MFYFVQLIDEVVCLNVASRIHCLCMQARICVPMLLDITFVYNSQHKTKFHAISIKKEG
jgi:hypothetical protein